MGFYKGDVVLGNIFFINKVGSYIILFFIMLKLDFVGSEYGLY